MILNSPVSVLKLYGEVIYNIIILFVESKRAYDYFEHKLVYASELDGVNTENGAVSVVKVRMNKESTDIDGRQEVT